MTGRRWRVRRTVRGSRADAQVVLSELQVQVDKGAFRGTSHELGPHLEHCLDFRSDDLAPRTLEVWRGAVKSRIAPALGDRPLGKLTPADLDHFYLTLRRREGLALRTVRHLHAIIHGALKQAVKWGYISSNPADLATLPRQQRPEVHPPAPEDVKRLLEHAEANDPELATFIVVAASCGAPARGSVCAAVA